METWFARMSHLTCFTTFVDIDLSSCQKKKIEPYAINDTGDLAILESLIK